jgi:ankyrin repeat protein
MADLPAKPRLDHLRRQARDLLRAAQAGDTKAAGRIRAVSDVLTLATVDARGDDGGTPLHAAAYSGSGEQPASHPHPDWTGTVQALLDAGASARDITLSPDDPKPPSPEVAALLRRHGGR